VAVITVFRQAGDGGRYIAENLAEALGYHLFDYRTAERILVQEGLSDARKVFKSTTDFWDRFTRKGTERDEVHRMFRWLILATAHHGNVVMLGRGCFAALQGLSDVLNVRLWAPLPVRIKRVMRAHEMTHDEAAAFVAGKDALVADFARDSHGLSPDDPTFFDLVIDTGKVTRDSAVRILVEAVGSLKVNSNEEPTAAALKVDSLMEKEVAYEFERVERLRTQADR
jgi:cytidylate kinase